MLVLRQFIILLLSELTIELLKRETKLTDEQLDSKVEEADLPEVAACFDNTEDYAEKLGLSPGQQNDVMRTQASLNSTQAGIKVALKYWRNSNPVHTTFRALLLILLSLLKGDVAVRVCKYLYNKCKSIGQIFHTLPPSTTGFFKNHRSVNHLSYSWL